VWVRRMSAAEEEEPLKQLCEALVLFTFINISFRFLYIFFVCFVFYITLSVCVCVCVCLSVRFCSGELWRRHGVCVIFCFVIICAAGKRKFVFN